MNDSQVACALGFDITEPAELVVALRPSRYCPADPVTALDGTWRVWDATRPARARA